MTRIARLHLMRILLALLLPLAAVGSARAQQTTMDAAAAQMAEAVSHANKKTVVLTLFLDSDLKLTQLGHQITRDFGAALVKSAHGFNVIDDSENPSPGEDFLKTTIRGSLSVGPEDPQNLQVYAQCFSGKKIIAMVSFKVPLSKETQDQIHAIIGDPAPTAIPDLPQAGKNGYTLPHCIHCPEARFTTEAARNKTQGAVTLDMVVGIDGRPGKIAVVKPLPNGLTEEAVKAVEKWRLKPADGPDGKPAAVVERVIVAFRLY